MGVGPGVSPLDISYKRPFLGTLTPALLHVSARSDADGPGC